MDRSLPLLARRIPLSGAAAKAGTRLPMHLREPSPRHCCSPWARLRLCRGPHRAGDRRRRVPQGAKAPVSGASEPWVALRSMEAPKRRRMGRGCGNGRSRWSKGSRRRGLASAWRRCSPGHKPDQRLAHVLLDRLRGQLLGVAPNLADHHDGLGLRGLAEQPLIGSLVRVDPRRSWRR